MTISRTITWSGVRVEAAGGFVQWNRVDGDLAVSRALGDFTYKNRPDLPAEEQKVR